MRPIWTLTIAAAALCAAPAAAEDARLREELLKLNTLTGNGPIEGMILQLSQEPDKAKALLAAGRDLIKGKEPQLNYNAAFTLGRVAQVLKETKAGEDYFRLAAEQALQLQSVSKVILVYDGLVELYYDSKQFDKAVSVCKEFLELDAKGDESLNAMKPFVMERMVQAMAKQGKVDEALKLADKLVQADDGGWYFLQLKGWIQREAGKFDEAVRAYHEVIEKVEKSRRLDPDKRALYTRNARYVLSSLYIDLKQIDKASEQLQALLKEKPDSPTYNNDLGYIWADHGMNLDESEKLIRKAIEEDRKQREAAGGDASERNDNPAYLDSLGWVLFKKKDYKAAKEYLLLAVKDKDGQHAEIYDHLAEVQAALGETDDAVANWKKALEQEPVSKRDEARKEEIRKKLAKYQK